MLIFITIIERINTFTVKLNNYKRTNIAQMYSPRLHDKKPQLSNL